MGKKHNLEKAKKIAIFAGKYNAKILIYPYMQPHGPLIDYIVFKSEKREKYRRVNEVIRILRSNALSLKGSYLLNLWITCRNHGVDAIIPGLLEVAGPRLYVTMVALPSLIGPDIFASRKIILNRYERYFGVKHGREIHILKLPEINIGMFLDDEIYYPEIIRMMKFEGASILVYGMSQISPPKNYSTLLKSLSLMFKTWIIHPGSIICDRGSCSWRTPTIIVDDRGEMFEYHGGEQALILIPLSIIKTTPLPDDSSRLIARIYYRYIARTSIHKRRIGGYSGRGGESISH